MTPGHRYAATRPEESGRASGRRATVARRSATPDSTRKSRAAPPDITASAAAPPPPQIVFTDGHLRVVSLVSDDHPGADRVLAATTAHRQIRHHGPSVGLEFHLTSAQHARAARVQRCGSPFAVLKGAQILGCRKHHQHRQCAQ